MRIAFVNQPRDYMVASAAQRGSLSIVTWELARRLADQHEVTVYAPCAPGQTFEEQAGRLTIRRTPRALRRLHRALDLVAGMIGARPPYFARGAYFAEYFAAIARRLRRDPPHVVHVQTASQFIPKLRRIVPQARLVLHVHDVHLASVHRPLVESHLAHADAIVTCSDYVTQHLRAHFAAYAGRIATIGNGVDLDVFHPAPPNMRPLRSPAYEILYLGRVSPEKGVHVLAAAFERVLDAFPEARLSIIGPAGLLPYSRVRLLHDDEHAASLEEFYGHSFGDKLRRQVLHASRSYIDDVVSRMSKRAAAQVNVAGLQEYTDVPKFYRRASVLVAPSVLAEPFGLPLVEALASGVPVIATRAGGMQGIVDDGVTGRLVARNDVAGLARAICDILANPTLAARMGHAARAAAVERFGWQRAAARLEDVYLRLTALEKVASGGYFLPRRVSL
jgi:spore coat protein SA